jgi:hypothetical protein
MSEPDVLSKVKDDLKDFRLQVLSARCQMQNQLPIFGAPPGSGPVNYNAWVAYVVHQINLNVLPGPGDQEKYQALAAQALTKIPHSPTSTDCRSDEIMAVANSTTALQAGTKLITDFLKYDPPTRALAAKDFQIVAANFLTE